MFWIGFAFGFGFDFAFCVVPGFVYCFVSDSAATDSLRSARSAPSLFLKEPDNEKWF